MYSSGDLERFYFQYPTEAMPKGISVEQFCSRNKVPCKMVQGYTQQASRSEGGWLSMLGSRKAEGGKAFRRIIIDGSKDFFRSYTRGVAHDQSYLGKFFTKIFSGCRDFFSLRPDKIGLAICQWLTNKSNF